MGEEITPEIREWFSSRLHETPSGRVIVSTSLVNKYRKITGDYLKPTALIRSDIIDIFYNDIPLRVGQ